MRISDWSSDVCSSDLDVGGMNLGEAMPYSGKNLRILGQASEKRSPLAPAVPTFKEQGIDLVFASERGLVGPAGMPAEVTERLRGALNKIANSPEVQKHIPQQIGRASCREGVCRYVEI